MTALGGGDSSIRKALAILDCYREGERELGVSELSRRTGIAKSTVHRVCAELADAGYIKRTDRRGFALTLAVFELGSAVTAPVAVGQVASRFLQQMSVLTGETSHLATLDEGDVLYLDKIETLRSEKVPSSVGQRNPAYSTAIGKAILAWNLAEVDEYLSSPDGKLQRFTPNTIGTVAELREELALVRSRGVAFDRGERNVNVACVAAPVRNHLWCVVAAISVAGPTSRMTEERLVQVAPVVRNAADALSGRLGWSPANQLRAVGQ